jgi:hypothetical protein
MFNRKQIEMFPPQLERRAQIPAGTVFDFGRPLLVVETFGDDAAAPVIVEELVETEYSLKGQLGLWSLDGVTRAMRQKK